VTRQSAWERVEVSNAAEVFESFPADKKYLILFEVHHPGWDK
jgi:hypothetical protein